MKLRPGPTVEPLDSAAELAARRTITHALVDARWNTDSWATAEAQAVDLLAHLKDAGLELFKVTWR